MLVVIPTETAPDERRVAATPETVKKLITLGQRVRIQKGAGKNAGFLDSAYQDAGAELSDTPATEDADIILHVQPPANPLPYKKGAVVLGLLSPFDRKDDLKQWAGAGINTVALELLPRITRAQSMDVLSSQANLAGYRAVIESGAAFGRAFPMLMTAAGTIPPARVLVLGAGVAGLQAIATAKRLGAIVTAFDVRQATKEQVQSLGATFLDIEGSENLETSGGYAKEASADTLARQQAKIRETLLKTDIVITTAAIPGKPSPRLITEDMLTALKPGSVIADLAAERGGNCAATKPGEVIVTSGGVTILGHRNWASRIPFDASALYARNILHFFTAFFNKESGTLNLDKADPIIAGALLTQDGAVVHPHFV
ncbi:MAG: Re/Si-specific NAD(P)(+) transhydrogenase subunit alpha [Holosporales bacterium]